MKKKYVKVVKESWDMLWHAYYYAGKKITWDRVPEEKAVQIARKLVA